jgi:hypothetical protein
MDNGFLPLGFITSGASSTGCGTEISQIFPRGIRLRLEQQGSESATMNKDA